MVNVSGIKWKRMQFCLIDGRAALGKSEGKGEGKGGRQNRIGEGIGQAKWTWRWRKGGSQQLLFLKKKKLFESIF